MYHQSRVFHRQLIRDLPRAIGGEGVYLFDSDGKRYLDASGGAAVSCLGHGDSDVINAIKNQLDTMAFAHTGFFTSAPSEELAAFLIDKAPEGFGSVYFVSGGSEAIEAALKMARQYFLEIGEPNRSKFIGRRQSYHGNTLGALSVGGNIWRREPFKDLLTEVYHISPCYAYRGCRDGESEEEYGHRVAEELDAQINRLGAKNVAAFIAETVGGATAGVIPPVLGYFKRIREICDKHGVLLILDEVMCGMGRTGTLFACEQENISPDIVCIAKGLGAGYQPIGATLVKAKIHETFQSGSGVFNHGHTYMGHPAACAGALAVQKKIQSNNMLPRVARIGKELKVKLVERFGNHPNIGDIRGRGLFLGIELVKDRLTKNAFDPAFKLNAKVKSSAMDAGLICYPGGGTVDGLIGDHILIAPPFIITSEELDELVKKLGIAVDAAIKQIH